MNTRSAIAMLCVASFAHVGIAAEKQELAGQVTRVIDGDTLELTVEGDRVVSIRLAQIDAPERSQPYGSEATAALSALTLGNRVRVDVVTLDRYGRTIGEIYREELHVNSEMVRQGHAWAYTRYATSLEIIDLEDEARQHERGLWKLPSKDRDPPWQWRKHGAGGSASDSESPIADTVCGSKRTCKEMLSCAEARMYLSQCGLTGLDGDGDGVPCEAQCRE